RKYTPVSLTPSAMRKPTLATISPAPNRNLWPAFMGGSRRVPWEQYKGLSRIDSGVAGPGQRRLYRPMPPCQPRGTLVGGKVRLEAAKSPAGQELSGR